MDEHQQKQRKTGDLHALLGACAASRGQWAPWSEADGAAGPLAVGAGAGRVQGQEGREEGRQLVEKQPSSCCSLTHACRLRAAYSPT